MIKILALALFTLILTSCSKVTYVTTEGVNQYYGINLIDIKNSDKNISYIKVEGVGIVQALNSLTIGYVKEEQIYANPKVCQAILIIDANRTTIDSLIEQMNNICIIRR